MGLAPPPSPRRTQLADFLRTRRAAIPPDEPSARRRTPGLRREEVAARAGVGLSWYTWLEQGRDVSPSAPVLQAIARALELGPAEEDYLFLLTGVLRPDPLGAATVEPDEETRELVGALAPHIAFVLNPRFDVVAHNRGAELILGDLLAEPPERRNLLRWLFGRESDWDGMRDGWAETARANLLDFRAEYVRHLDDPSYVDLVAELEAGSRTFRPWWAEHGVRTTEPARKRIVHKRLGPLNLLLIQSQPAHQPALRLRVLVPTDDRTREVLAAATR